MVRKKNPKFLSSYIIDIGAETGLLGTAAPTVSGFSAFSLRLWVYLTMFH